MLLNLVTTEINTQAMITICSSFEALESTPVKKVCTDRLFHISKLHKLTDLTGTSRCTLTEISQQRLGSRVSFHDGLISVVRVRVRVPQRERER